MTDQRPLSEQVSPVDTKEGDFWSYGGDDLDDRIRALEAKVDMSDLVEVLERQLGRINDQLYSLWERMP